MHYAPTQSKVLRPAGRARGVVLAQWLPHGRIDAGDRGEPAVRHAPDRGNPAALQRGWDSLRSERDPRETLAEECAPLPRASCANW